MNPRSKAGSVVCDAAFDLHYPQSSWSATTPVDFVKSNSGNFKSFECITHWSGASLLGLSPVHLRENASSLTELCKWDMFTAARQFMPCKRVQRPEDRQSLAATIKFKVLQSDFRPWAS